MFFAPRLGTVRACTRGKKEQNVQRQYQQQQQASGICGVLLLLYCSDVAVQVVPFSEEAGLRYTRYIIRGFDGPKGNPDGEKVGRQPKALATRL